jgi:hypothetical protein
MNTSLKLLKKHYHPSPSQLSQLAWKDLDNYAKIVDLDKPASNAKPGDKVIMSKGQEILFSRSLSQLQPSFEEKSNTFYNCDRE